MWLGFKKVTICSALALTAEKPITLINPYTQK